MMIEIRWWNIWWKSLFKFKLYLTIYHLTIYHLMICLIYHVIYHLIHHLIISPSTISPSPDSNLFDFSIQAEAPSSLFYMMIEISDKICDYIFLFEDKIIYISHTINHHLPSTISSYFIYHQLTFAFSLSNSDWISNNLALKALF